MFTHTRAAVRRCADGNEAKRGGAAPAGIGKFRRFSVYYARKRTAKERM